MDVRESVNIVGSSVVGRPTATVFKRDKLLNNNWSACYKECAWVLPLFSWLLQSISLLPSFRVVDQACSLPQSGIGCSVWLLLTIVQRGLVFQVSCAFMTSLLRFVAFLLRFNGELFCVQCTSYNLPVPLLYNVLLRRTNLCLHDVGEVSLSKPSQWNVSFQVFFFSTRHHFCLLFYYILCYDYLQVAPIFATPFLSCFIILYVMTTSE